MPPFKKYKFVLVIAMVSGLLLGACSHTSPEPVAENHITIPAQEGSAIAVRTESYARPPYSGATYFLYEKDGQVICTKLKVCNKYNECETTYKSGLFRDEEEMEEGVEPFEKTESQVIAPEKLKLHQCLELLKKEK
ncbi:hypothetical protein [Pseudobdellovibrio exovorus]|uniref:Lipoprotein n=1 Tax=Pseudobdellovibrio exovorus JSS TaxID=1184267 RepID=M4VQI0_9BACT|nr:hypothetical protein [Pseudobdellovibrio exovorus]AGH95414.1 hypothetical protein A11Q_1198 [Pseudobdellovibrio exovorus JSS]